MLDTKKPRKGQGAVPQSGKQAVSHTSSGSPQKLAKQGFVGKRSNDRAEREKPGLLAGLFE